MPHSRNIFIVNRRFQLRFAFFVCSWLFALSLVYPLIIYSLFDYFVHFISLHFAAPAGTEGAIPSLAALQGTREQIVWLLALLQLAFLSVTFLISIFISHRIAGPVYKLGKTLHAARSGPLSESLRFRKNDHFHEIAGEYNKMTRGICERIEAAKALLQKGKTSEAIAALDQITAKEPD